MRLPSPGGDLDVNLPISVPIESANLSDEALWSIVGQLSEEDSEVASEEAERRTHRRYHRIPVVLHTKSAGNARAATYDGGQSSFMILAENISRGGLAFCHRSPLNPGSFFNVKIMLLSADPLTTTGQVVRCHPMDDGRYDIGFQFDNELSSDHMPW